MLIQSVRNEKIKLLQRLGRRRHRLREGLYVIEGPRLLQEALTAGAPVRAVFVAPALLPERWRSLLEGLPSGVPVYEVANSVFLAVAETEAPQGILATVELPRWAEEDLFRPGPGGPPLVVLVDGIQDPGNLGSILRTAGALGAGGVALGRGTVDAFNGKVVRAGAGVHFRLPILSGLDLETAAEAARGRGLALVAAVPAGGAEPWEADFRRPLAIVVGAEGAGVSRALVEAAELRVTVPMPGGGESLNAAVACSILLYECLRQRAAPDGHPAPLV